ncbi:MAG TPA: 50S ribosomal protein L25 [Candidatus Pacearchaeota archaeon]|nr:50S ribosomal protein L25 [Candidatus Pacearchaeota archaeon]HPR80285.1 50S ribosomal protein L25 [Candidatus Pacearchaeota archaeon]
MTSLIAKIREKKGTAFRAGYGADSIPAVLYGSDVENMSLEIDKKSFEKVFRDVGETLIDLEVDGKKYSVLIHDTQVNPLTQELIHVDFYQPNLKEEVETEVPLELIGEAPALKLGGTLIMNMKEISVSALPKDLPSKIVIDVSTLNTFEDAITVKDIKVPAGVTIEVENPEEIIVQVVEPEDVEEELAKPIEEVNKEPEQAAPKKEEEVVPEEEK